ncbi:arginine-hydroxylase NDUFAF5, mitochondrial isoform X2 [Copidosoma floridanum]|uniref:arginine-hydroxylase NDUFAF5, mitochondrial isoform X2 n=1 Tax=Copidosoma floridanum TaxID=29053 RepID=UPI0006C9CE12|nr:arginine-hydroxylase NDUFAF5, mitochondrial isoform X2 [Copidosoma floridanum]
MTAVLMKTSLQLQQQLLVVEACNIMDFRILRRQIKTSNSVLSVLPNLMYIFDRNAKLFQRERAAQANDVHVYDYIKDEVGSRLADRVFDIKRKFDCVLNLGCGRGHVSKNITNETTNELILSDLSPSWLQQASTAKGIKVKKIVSDEEELAFKTNNIDFIISCLSLHWVNNLPHCLNNIIRILKNDGVFMAAVFGGETLYELRGALHLAELERDGGIAPHISPFTEIRDIGSLLTKAGFAMLTIDTDEIVVGYPTMFELMWDLKVLGVPYEGVNSFPYIESTLAKPVRHLPRNSQDQVQILLVEVFRNAKKKGAVIVKNKQNNIMKNMII